MSIDFHRLIEPIDINRLIFIDYMYIDYIDCFPMIDFHRLVRPGKIVQMFLNHFFKFSEDSQRLIDYPTPFSLFDI